MYDIPSDGKKLVVTEQVGEEKGPLMVVVNWSALLKNADK